MELLTLLVRYPWVYFILLLCAVKLAHQTSQDDIDEALHDIKDLILGKLDDMDYKMSQMDARLKQMDTSPTGIEDNLGELKDQIIGKLNDMDARIKQIESTIVNDLKCKVEERSSLGLTLIENTVGGPVKELIAQGSAILEDIKSLKDPVNKILTQESVLNEQLETVKEDNNSSNTILNTLDNNVEVYCDPSTHFNCHSGECIIKSWRCDNDYDCFDKSDEEGCDRDEEVSTGDATYFTCGDGAYVSKRWRCDGESDCSDGSDEQNCH